MGHCLLRQLCTRGYRAEFPGHVGTGRRSARRQALSHRDGCMFSAARQGSESKPGYEGDDAVLGARILEDIGQPEGVAALDADGRDHEVEIGTES